MRRGRVVLGCAELARLDASAAAAGVPVESLMERAGAAVADAIRARSAPRRTLVLCGPGDNGGDGYVAARRLAEAGWAVRVAALGSPKSGTAAAAARASWTGEVAPLDANVLGDAELIVDALFGAGLTRPLDGSAAATTDAARASSAVVVTVDLPSGVSGDLGRPLGPAFAADLTVTFARWKPAHLLEPARSLCGELVLADIGHPDAAFDALAPSTFENGPPLWAARWPWPSAASHKHVRGRLLVVTGGAASTGAARLAARAGLRVGAGLVTLLTPPSALLVAAASSTAVMTRAVADAAALGDEAGRAHAVVIGPGAGVGQGTADKVAAVLATPACSVLDADALTVFGDDPSRLFAMQTGAPGRVVLTPHRGEFARLFPDLDPDDDKLAAVRAAAERAGAVVLLKGADTVIAEPGGRVAINTRASPFLATAGSGDVLAGLIGGLMAQGMDAFDAAAGAAWLHGDAACRLGPGMIAEDLCEALPKALDDLYHAVSTTRVIRREPVGDSPGGMAPTES
jgi:NAD(P)H-hydrate epimerase